MTGTGVTRLGSPEATALADELRQPVAGAVDRRVEHPELVGAGAAAAAQVPHEDEALEVQDEVVELGETIKGYVPSCCLLD